MPLFGYCTGVIAWNIAGISLYSIMTHIKHANGALWSTGISTAAAAAALRFLKIYFHINTV